ncbi:hypothetical protein [Pseudovibrio axinellae]|nr:hypothetical protein [Pseudovibrio axinellae]
MVGPKPLGFEEKLLKAKFFQGDKLLRARHRKLKQVHEVWIKVSPDQEIAVIDVEINGTHGQLEVSPNPSRDFKGKRVLSTLCKDTPVPWILDWLRFHVTNHGVDALVLFENSEDPAHADDIHQAILQENLKISVEIVHAPFKYGPPKLHAVKFLQRSLLQLLRWKYVQPSEALLFCDVDEFVVCQDGKSIFDGLKKSFLGYFLIPGVWVEPVTQTDQSQLKTLGDRRHHMFQHTMDPPKETHRKWVAAPSRIPKSIQFKAHGVRPEPKYAAWLHPFFTRQKPYLKTSKLFHFRAMSTSWKSDREAISPVSSDKHSLHKDLNTACETAFPHLAKVREPS